MDCLAGNVLAWLHAEGGVHGKVCEFVCAMQVIRLEAWVKIFLGPNTTNRFVGIEYGQVEGRIDLKEFFGCN